jgi:hypothetical protein
MTPEDLAWAKRRFYELIEWDSDTGEPCGACLRELKLDSLRS